MRQAATQLQFCSTQQQALSLLYTFFLCKYILYLQQCHYKQLAATLQIWFRDRDMRHCVSSTYRVLRTGCCCLFRASCCDDDQSREGRLGLPRKGAKQPITLSQSSIDGTKPVQQHTLTRYTSNTWYTARKLFRWTLTYNTNDTAAGIICTHVRFHFWMEMWSWLDIMLSTGHITTNNTPKGTMAVTTARMLLYGCCCALLLCTMCLRGAWLL